MDKYIWIGPRESDIGYTKDFFSASITLYGSNENNNESFSSTQKSRINHNHITDEQTHFMNSKEIDFLNKCENIKFMSYNPYLLNSCDLRVQKNAVCYNPHSLLEFLNSKINFRNISKRICLTLLSENIKGDKCSLNYFQQLYPNFDKFVVQADISSGGYGTFLIDRKNEKDILCRLDKDNIYLVSPYYEKNIPVNIHAIIYDDDILIFPASIQIIIEDNGCLLYRGADYVAYKKEVSICLKNKFKENTLKLCEEIKKLGYRGVLGIDAMIVNEKIFMLEMNNRFQASTILLNKVLSEINFKTIPELNLESFTKKKASILQSDLDDVCVNYSCFTYIKESNNIYKTHTDKLLERFESSKFVSDILLDGYSKTDCDIEDDAYLFRVIFNTNIVGMSPEKKVTIHPNLLTPDYNWFEDIRNKKDFVKIKIGLLNQGVVLTNEAKQHLKKNGGMQPGVYCSVDLIVDGKYAINSPLYVKFAELSPFTIDYKINKLSLLYYKYKICDVSISSEDNLSKLITLSGVPLKNICLKSLDRLRIQNSDFCIFKENHVPCRFCEVQYKSINFNISDILESIDQYFVNNEISINHILIGGLSNKIGYEKSNILRICKHIRKYSDMNIYLMCLPPLNMEDIDEYVDNGVTEIGFNIEIYDRSLAKEFMPGKGKIKLEQYINALSRAVELLGKEGAVRSAFVVGLESKYSLLNGIEKLCQIGVAPILSVFRPIPGTEMQDRIVPSNQFLYDIYMNANCICKKYDLELGPNCAFCQNNTLSLKEIN